MDASASASASAAAATSPPAPAQLLECYLCNLSFDTIEEKRQHAKSEWHVYKIRCRVAEPGTTVPPPGSSGPKSPARRQNQNSKSASKQLHAAEEGDDEESESDISSESDSSSDQESIQFVPEECLFCNQTSKDFDENLSHMHQAHSLVIPFQSSLVVDLQTLVWFLHMVIFSYRECICCGKRRRTLEAVQQHMTSLGHCRFDVTEEMSAFYDMDSLNQGTAGNSSHPDDYTLRLPSGKLLGHRSYVDPTSRSWLRERAPAGPSALPASQDSEAGSQALTKGDQKEQALTTRISQLRTGDQMSLMHLPQSQQRSLLLAHKKALDEAKRAERRTRRRVDNAGNITAIHTKYYKQEVPVYMGG
ncbi:related to TRI15 - putative transcription factor [Cephalotrichum gorgonifer]|uniref:Related to TRI15 - putative transcription factor n=1 Tax=Cephalotrichum gorgonifer TaxID=2041049 RepID=A0AAE8SX47_9PEZI|nr:related to TRI15 - putative transcription factor [Cephalotrichum gorgonifer]